MPEGATDDTRALIKHAEQRGLLSRRSSEVLRQAWVVQGIQQTLIHSYQLKRPGRTILITMMPDDSNSMRFVERNQTGVIEGHNELLGMLAVSADNRRILLQTRYLNGFVLNAFAPLQHCKNLDRQNYPCLNGTPLYEQTLVTLATVIAKTEELSALGAKVRTATLLMTDAESEDKLGDEWIPAVASVIADMRNIGDHIVAGMGFPSGDASYCRRVFAQMGIDAKYIFDASSREEILKAFRLFGKSALELGRGTS